MKMTGVSGRVEDLEAFLLDFPIVICVLVHRNA
jgi:hypothetical protein